MRPFVCNAHRARLAVLLLTLGTIVGGYYGRRPVVTGTVQPGEMSDVKMHEIVADRVNKGDSYYDALGDELRHYGYALRPFFHWRLPTLLWILGNIPNVFLGKLLLAGLAMVMVVIWLVNIKPDVGFPLTCFAAFTFAVPSLTLAVLDGWYFQHELWAGVLIALSLGIHNRSWPASVAFGLAALAIRELALPYALIMLFFATYQKRYRESLCWAAGIAGFAVFLAVHAHIVAMHTLSTDPSDPSWIRFSGWPHAVACANWQFLGLAPYWVAGGVFVLNLFGAVTAKQPRLAATVISYTVAFCIAGKPFNDYWGLVYTPLLAASLPYAAKMILDLTRAARIIPSQQRNSA